MHKYIYVLKTNRTHALNPYMQFLYQAKLVPKIRTFPSGLKLEQVDPPPPPPPQLYPPPSLRGANAYQSPYGHTYTPTQQYHLYLQLMISPPPPPPNCTN